MAQVKDILIKEKERTTMEQCRSICLYLEGSFYHAYEWSAWLCVRYVQEFKATRRLQKNSTTESVVFIGFPITSLGKFFGEGIKPNPDKSITVMLREDIFAEKNDPAIIKNDFENWKQSVPLTENSKKRLEIEKYGEQVKMTDVLHDILAYPVESSTPIETMNFLAELKRKVAKII